MQHAAAENDAVAHATAAASNAAAAHATAAAAAAAAAAAVCMCVCCGVCSKVWQNRQVSAAVFSLGRAVYVHSISDLISYSLPAVILNVDFVPLVQGGTPNPKP